jgi:phosphate transport system substrate-binding protein
VLLALSVAFIMVRPGNASATGPLIGAGSSFAGPEVLQWTTDAGGPPYNLTVDYTPSSSGQGRFDFALQTVDFAVTDIPYQGPAFDAARPTFPFIYVPISAGGVAFMYHLNGLPPSTTLQLSSHSICALMTGQVTMWNDPVIQADNPGVTLPATPVHPVIRVDLAGTNLALQEYCIHEQSTLWASFINAPVTAQFPGQVGDLSATQPRSDWPLFAGAILASGSSNAADDVVSPSSDGYITPVEPAYAIQRHVPVASVKNASGFYTQPTPLDVSAALTHATQNTNDTSTLDFGGLGPDVYNPSTFSDVLVPTTGLSPAKGAVLSAFINYALTLGQQEAPRIGYASLGQSLEDYGVDAVHRLVPGAVALTSAEEAVLDSGPPTQTPEVPFALVLPIGAGLLMGVAYRRRGRRLQRDAEEVVVRAPHLECRPDHDSPSRRGIDHPGHPWDPARVAFVVRAQRELGER